MHSSRLVRLLVGAVGLLSGATLSGFRIGALGSTVPARLQPYLFLWSLAGYCVLLLFLAISPRRPLLRIAATVLPDVAAHLAQGLTPTAEAAFFTLNFMPLWQALVFLPLTTLLTRRTDRPDRGPLGHPFWSWGLWLVAVALVAQTTPRPAALARLSNALSASTALILLAGLGVLAFSGLRSIRKARA